MTVFKAAAIQMRSTPDPARNIAAMTGLVREAAGNGASYVQTPEMTGALMRDRAGLLAIVCDEAGDPVCAAASGLAREYGIWLHVGSTPIACGGGRVANRALLFAPDGGVRARYDKIHMFDVDLDNGESWRESATYRPGTGTVVVDTPLATIGMAICYDIRFPQLFRKQAEAGATVLTAPAAFTRQTGAAHWHVLQRARAIECGAFVISAAQGGTHEDGRETFGHSIIVDPWGVVIAEAAHHDPAVVIAEIDTSRSAAVRARIPNLKNARAFTVSHIATGPQEAVA
ncbi:MAG TPA: carbon-nitrogen hydrolase family protein [Rhizobiaceae bacterium]|nr:carbon-nitrogen hydrolase family protein [Rhizobiaceae bacterium]